MARALISGASRGIGKAAASLGGDTLDMLVNSAGIFGDRGAGLGRIDDGIWHEVLATNGIDACRATEAYLPQLPRGQARARARSSSPSPTGWAAWVPAPQASEYVDRSSKAAVDAEMKSVAIDLAHEGIIVTILHPGWVRTDMNGQRAALDVAASARGLAEVILPLTPAQSGGFFNYDGATIVW